VDAAHAKVVGSTFEPHGLARSPETDFDFGAHGNPLEMVCENVREVAVSFVASVEANFFAEEAARDADANGTAIVRAGFHSPPR